MSYSGWMGILPYPVNPPSLKDRDHGSHSMSILFWTLAAMHHHHSCIEMFSQTPIRRPCALKCIFKLSDKFPPSHPHSFACGQLHNFKSSWVELGVRLEAKKKKFVLMQHKHRVAIIALGSLVSCLTPVSELAMTSALFTFKVSAHTQRLNQSTLI